MPRIVFIDEDSVLSIHDPWSSGMGLGDVDDWAAIYYLAKVVIKPIIYLVSDVKVENIAVAPGQSSTRANAFLALHQDRLLALNPNIKFVSDETWNIDLIQQCAKIIICARVGSRDQKLLDWLKTPSSLKDKEVYGQGVGPGSYNFGTWPLNVSKDPECNLLPTTLNIPATLYTSDSVNRRVTRTQLSYLIQDDAIINLMMMYGFMKNICLPSAPGTIGFLVRHANSGAVNPNNPNGFNPGLGNNAYGIALYRGLDVSKGMPSVLIQNYIASKGDKQRGDKNKWVNAKLNTPGIREFMKTTNYNTTNRGPEVENLFCEALAVAVELFLEYVVSPDPTSLLINGFPNLSTHLTFRLPPVQVTSPLWDLFTVACILNKITPAQIQGDLDLNGLPNSFPSKKLLRLAGLDPYLLKLDPTLLKLVPFGGKKRKTKKHRTSTKK